MKTTTSHVSLILSGTALLAGMLLLTTFRLEYCGQPEALRPRGNAATAANAPTPTLAPPVKVVFVRVEADKSDLEVGWLDK
jgi:hypothetical protein